MRKRELHPVVRLALGLILGLGISVISLNVAQIVPGADSFPFMSGFTTHTVMWVLSIIASLYLTKARLRAYGFTKGKFRLNPTIFLWVLPMAFISTIGYLVARPDELTGDPFGMSQMQAIVFIWIYASISEEIFTRGLLQSYVSPLRKYGFKLFGKIRLSIPVLFSGLFFGLMHIVAVGEMGPPVIVFTTFAGIVAAYHREKTESLIPAIIIHMLFNIGGSLPVWILQQL
jgi:membrane protease YdiL (CAAX protease family)